MFCLRHFLDKFRHRGDRPDGGHAVSRLHIRPERERLHFTLAQSQPDYRQRPRDLWGRLRPRRQ